MALRSSGTDAQFLRNMQSHKNIHLATPDRRLCRNVIFTQIFVLTTEPLYYLNVYQYLELLLTEIPKHMNDTDLKFIDKLLPWAPRVQENSPSRFKKS